MPNKTPPGDADRRSAIPHRGLRKHLLCHDSGACWGASPTPHLFSFAAPSAIVFFQLHPPLTGLTEGRLGLNLLQIVHFLEYAEAQIHDAKKNLQCNKNMALMKALNSLFSPGGISRRFQGRLMVRRGGRPEWHGCGRKFFMAWDLPLPEPESLMPAFLGEPCWFGLCAGFSKNQTTYGFRV